MKSDSGFSVLNVYVHPFFVVETDKQDKHAVCPVWAKEGYCKTDEDITRKCSYSCLKYEEVPAAPKPYPHPIIALHPYQYQRGQFPIPTHYPSSYPSPYPSPYPYPYPSPYPSPNPSPYPSPYPYPYPSPSPYPSPYPYPHPSPYPSPSPSPYPSPYPSPQVGANILIKYT